MLSNAKARTLWFIFITILFLRWIEYGNIPEKIQEIQTQQQEMNKRLAELKTDGLERLRDNITLLTNQVTWSYHFLMHVLVHIWLNYFFFNTIFVSSHMYPENPGGTQVIVGSVNMGYISDTARNRTHNLFHPRREPIPLSHSDGLLQWISGRYASIPNSLVSTCLTCCAISRPESTKMGWHLGPRAWQTDLAPLPGGWVQTLRPSLLKYLPEYCMTSPLLLSVSILNPSENPNVQAPTSCLVDFSLLYIFKAIENLF